MAKEYGYTFGEFTDLEPYEQARIIAHSRITHQIDAVLNKDANDKAKLAQKQ